MIKNDFGTKFREKIVINWIFERKIKLEHFKHIYKKAQICSKESKYPINDVKINKWKNMLLRAKYAVANRC